jgi:hypothetical protein
MAPATAATPDPDDPPVNTITAEEWDALLARGVVLANARRDSQGTLSFTDLEAVARQLTEERRRDAQDRRRKQAGSN